MSLALGDVSVRMLLRGMSEIFLPMFSTRTSWCLWCYDLYLSLLSILNLFFCVAKVGDRVSFFSRSCPDLPTPFVEEAVFAPFYAPTSFVKY